MTSLSNYTICYEAIQRIYRNAVLKHLRDTLKVAYPVDYLDRIRRPFEKEWEQIRVSAQERRGTGELGSELTDEFDMLGVNHFFNLFDLYYEELCVSGNRVTKDQRTKKRNRRCSSGCE